MTAENSPRKVAEATAANRAMRRLLSRIAWAVIRNDGSAIDRLLHPRLHGQNLGTAQHTEINNAT